MKIVLFPGHARLRVRTGPELSVEMLRSILLVIDVVKQQGIARLPGAELDFQNRRSCIPVRERVKVPNDQLIVGLDIGTTKVCACIAERNEKGVPEVVGVGTAPSQGLRRGCSN